MSPQRILSTAAGAVAFVLLAAPHGAFGAGSPSALTDIHDIRGPIMIPYWWIRPAIAVAVLAALGLGFVAYRLLRNRVRPRAKTAAEAAMERIERARGLIAAGRAADFSAELSDAVREYIEARFVLPAAHKTTEEFLHDLLASKSSPIVGHCEALADFLSCCDLAKFARFALGAEQMATMITVAIRFVETTEAAKEPEGRSGHSGALHAAAAAAEVAS
jgi:hypothetical protein